MKFSQFADYLQKLEQTPKRLEITDIIKDLIQNLSPDETENAINLTLGQLKAPFATQRFNMAEKMMVRVLENAYGTLPEEIMEIIKRTGDLGDTALEISTNKDSSELSINEVYEHLLKIAKLEGTGSQEKKVAMSSNLLQKLSGNSAKYAVRIILGTTRLGFTALTIIDALSLLCAGDKSLKTQIEHKYNVHPDIALIAKKIKEDGIEGIDDISMETGIPLMPQKPQRLDTADETISKMGGNVYAEYKLDGTRVQLHLDRNKKSPNTEEDLFGTPQDVFVKTFTRNLDETTHQFPDIVEDAIKQIDANSVILDGEAIGFDEENDSYLPFQETIQRKRKHNVKETAAQIPLKYLVFDILYYNGSSVMEKSLKERKELLKNIIKPGGIVSADDFIETSDPKELQKFFSEAKDKKLEGLVVKNPQNGYEAGARSFTWVKLKRLEGLEKQKGLTDTIDCTILGYYFGRGSRSNFGIGGFLAGVYDPESDSYKTLSKVGSGLKDNEWVQLKEMADKIQLSQKPSNVEVVKELYPEVWTKPEIVVELRADEISKSSQHSAGYALRFPRLIKFRNDKKPTDTTSLKEIEEIYNLQY